MDGDSMGLKTIYKLSELSFECEPLVKVAGMDFSIIANDCDKSGVEIEIIIRFLKVLAYSLVTEGIKEHEYNAYLELCEIEDSDVLNGYAIRRPRYAELWKPRHFVINFPDVGQYEVIASSVVIKRNNVQICEKCGGQVESSTTGGLTTFTCLQCQQTFKYLEAHGDG